MSSVPAVVAFQALLFGLHFGKLHISRHLRDAWRALIFQEYPRKVVCSEQEWLPIPIKFPSNSVSLWMINRQWDWRKTEATSMSKPQTTGYWQLRGPQSSLIAWMIESAPQIAKNSDILTVWWLNGLGERLPGSSSQEPNMTPLGGFFLSALSLNYTCNHLNKFINQVKLKDSCARAMSPLGQGNKNVIPTNVPSLTYFRFPFMAVWSSSLCNSRYRMPILWVWRTVIQRVFAQETLHDQLHSKHDGSWSGESLSEWML